VIASFFRLLRWDGFYLKTEEETGLRSDIPFLDEIEANKKG